MTRILIVDDHPLMRQGIRQLLELQAELEIVGEAASGEEALEVVEELDPDMILLDLNMKGMSGIATLATMRERDVNACILMVTVSDNQDDVVTALRAGADGYLLKDLEPEDLLQAICQAAEGQLVVSPQLVNALAVALREDGSSSSEVLASLTQRELQILRRVARGHANKLIARDLDIAEATVKVHVKHLLKKLQLRSRVEAAVWAVEHKVA
ncbi:MAG: two-component system response regulator NarL [Halieaceae bacterium]|jgi:two-component system, NarL family, nitrate/nitrite response regulator NarL|nr:two-component system response regulator NarL [Halieaceae bacterium]